jgi:hypothetical protein
MRKRAGRLCALAVAALGVFPASAAGIVVDGQEPSDFDDGNVFIVESRDERNRLTVRSTLRGVTVREASGAPLTARGDCRRRSSRLVECPDVNDIYIDAGDGDDSVSYFGGAAEIYGGAGDDVLRVTGVFNEVFGGRGNDRLLGGDADDSLSGGRGEDELHGGRGDDELWGEGRAGVTGGAGFRGSGDDDLLDGGPGRDEASWAERRQGVSVDLRARRGGGPGERDTLRSIEDLSGGVGYDRLTGDARANRIRGSVGRDVLTGGSGDDVLDGGYASTLYGPSTDGHRDQLDCGRGDDHVGDAGLDPLPRDCEWLGSEDRGQLGGVELLAQPRREPDGRLLFDAVCPGSVLACRRRMVLVRDGAEFARSEDMELSSGQRAWIPVPGPLPRGVIEVRHEGTSDFGGEPQPYLFRYRLRN